MDILTTFTVLVSKYPVPAPLAAHVVVYTPPLNTISYNLSLIVAADVVQSLT